MHQEHFESQLHGIAPADTWAVVEFILYQAQNFVPLLRHFFLL